MEMDKLFGPKQMVEAVFLVFPLNLHCVAVHDLDFWISPLCRLSSTLISMLSCSSSNSIFKEVILLEALNLNINIDDFSSFCVVVNHLSFVWLCMLVIIDGDFICCLPSYDLPFKLSL